MSEGALRSWYLQLSPAVRSVAQTVIYGLCAATVVVAFSVSIHFVYANGIERLARESLPVFLIGSFLLIAATSGISGWMLSSFCPEAAGSGIPQLKAAFWKDFGQVPWRVVVVKFVGGVLSVGGGASLGREGPSVQLGGGVASNLAGAFGEPSHKRRPAAAAGAAAGLAAAFNTPIAAVTFVLEEIIGDLNSRLLGRVLLASVIGALAVHAALGAQPAFQLHASGVPGWPAYLGTPLAALLASAVGCGFQHTALAVRGWNKTVRRVPAWLRTLLGGLAVWLIGSLVFITTHRTGVFSLGYADLSAALDGNLFLRDAAVLLAAKFLATAVCYGLGGCGGIFAPSLFLGAMSGVAVAGLLSFVVPMATSSYMLLAVVGMSSCLAAVVRAPVTSILIVFEMTHEFALVPPLMVAALISQAVARRFTRENLYDALLTQDGLSIHHVMPPRDLQEWHDSPVSRVANFRPVCATTSDMSREGLARLLSSSRFERYPVIDDARRALGVLSRAEIEAALAEQRDPKPVPVPICRRDDTIRAVQASLIESSGGMVALVAGSGEELVGLITLHDLLRAQTAFTTSG